MTTRSKRASGERIADVAALVGDPTRAAMLALMMDGQSHTATELATAADVTAATASGHLSKMVTHSLLEVSARGRHRHFRLASLRVARMLESIMVVAGGPGLPKVPPELREARTCYDHLAGRLGVVITQSLLKSGAVNFSSGNAEVTPAGVSLFRRIRVDLSKANQSGRRVLCRPCQDWTERQPHLAGVVGKALLQRILELDWIERLPDSRAVLVTRPGRQGLARVFGYQLAG
jgi:DNA-binding transcriptional ArsR family regulator